MDAISLYRPSNRSLVLWTGILAAVFAIFIAPLTPAQSANSRIYTGLVYGVAVGGYDPVSYFNKGGPKRGNKDISYSYNGATWRFASTKNRDRFVKNPKAYVPQFGGHCAWAASKGYFAKGSPKAWTINSGKLYLNYNKAVRANWSKNIPANIKAGNKNWPNLRDQ